MNGRLLALGAALVSCLTMGSVRYDPTNLKIIGKTVGKSGNVAECPHVDTKSLGGYNDAYVDRLFRVVPGGPTRIIPFYTKRNNPYQGQVVNFQAVVTRLVNTTPGMSVRVVKFGPTFPPADSSANSFWISTPTDSIGNSWGTKARIDSLRVYGADTTWVYATLY
mgnify:CR=1 FL=1